MSVRHAVICIILCAVCFIAGYSIHGDDETTNNDARLAWVQGAMFVTVNSNNAMDILLRNEMSDSALDTVNHIFTAVTDSINLVIESYRFNPFAKIPALKGDTFGTVRQ